MELTLTLTPKHSVQKPPRTANVSPIPPKHLGLGTLSRPSNPHTPPLLSCWPNSSDVPQVYGDLLRKIGKHPDGPSVTSSGASGDGESRERNVSATAVDDAHVALLAQENGLSETLELFHRGHPSPTTGTKREF